MSKQAILQLLQQADAPLSGQTISRALGISRAAVWKCVEQLRREGYAIEAATNRGYRLCAEPDRLDAASVARELDGHAWAQHVVVLDSVDSTNNYAKRLAASGAPAGTAVIAGTQTAGRGRRGRSFFSPAGEGLYLSVILRPAARPEQIMHLTAMAAVAAARAVACVCTQRPQIKWTNDLVFGTRKLAGILTELSLVAESREVEYVVIGIGINCAQRAFPPELAEIATSICAQTGRTPARSALAAALLRELSRMDDALLTRRDEWLREFAENCVTLGREVQVIRGDCVRAAFAEGIGPEGELLVRYPDGTREAVASGEVTVRGMYGYV